MKLCDYGCGKEAKYQFKNGKRCCSENSKSCPQVKGKKKEIFMKKHGVDNPSKIKEVQEKRKNTWMQKYGVDHPSKNKEIQEKRKQTFIEKFGVDNPNKNKKVREKTKQTCMKKYGVDHNFKSKKVQEKKKKTLMERYGVVNPLKSKEVQEKIKQICFEKYGSTNYKQSLEAKENLLEKHPFFCQVEEIKIENNQFKVHCKNHNCANSKEKGGWFTPTSLEINNRIGALEKRNDGNYFYCSQECKTTCPAYNLRSDPERDTQLPYTQEQYETFRTNVLTRDNYICQFCGEPATHVHHERPVKLEPFHAVDPDYGWSCCEKCHYEKGHAKGTACSTGNLAAKVCGPVNKMEDCSVNHLIGGDLFELQVSTPER